MDIRLLAAALCLGCTGPAPEAAPSPSAPSPEAANTPAPAAVPHQVTVHGALFQIMHQGKTERQVDLAPAVGARGQYGLGALEGLGGEATLWDGELWLSTPDGHGGATAAAVPTTTAGATLWVTTNVSSWAEHTLTEDVPFGALDAFVRAQAKAAGLDVDGPLPFRLEGRPSRLDWHVIDGSKLPEGAHGHEAHLQHAVRGRLEAEPVTILGFYSPKHHGVFTHHDTTTHAHVIASSSGVSGHVDHVDMPAGARLLLPAM